MSMRSDDPRIEQHEIDGQAVVLPSDEAWSAMLDAGSLDGRPVGVKSLPAQFRQLAGTVPGLVVALGADQTPDKPWWVFHVVSVEGVLRRVHVERQKHACGWEGLTGNHRVLAIYLGTDDPLSRMKAHWDMAQASCPSCGEALSNPAIWTAALGSA